MYQVFDSVSEWNLKPLSDNLCSLSIKAFGVICSVSHSKTFIELIFLALEIVPAAEPITRYFAHFKQFGW
jgi:hypothetical protein